MFWQARHIHGAALPEPAIASRPPKREAAERPVLKRDGPMRPEFTVIAVKFYLRSPLGIRPRLTLLSSARTHSHNTKSTARRVLCVRLISLLVTLNC